MVKLIVVLGFTLVAGIAVSTADETSIIELGGLRQVKAVLTITKAEYIVNVRMLPVQCFDVATNARLNREMAREQALQALAKHLSEKEAVEFIVSGVQVGKAGTDGKFFTLSVQVPKRGVAAVGDGKKPHQAKAGEDRVAFKSVLFTRKKDYFDTLDKLMAAVDCDVKEAEEEEKESFNLAKAEIEERGLKNLEILRKETKNDLLLFSGEQEELNDALDRAKTRMLVQLKEAVNRQTIKEDAKKFSEVEIEKPFDGYLLANPLLMEMTGAKIIRLPNGNQVVVVVASTVLKDKSAQERLRAERVCRVKALASVVAEKKGVQVAHVEQLKERTVVILDNGKETGKSVSELLQITKTKVEGITRDMPVVGRWKSNEGDVYYLAIGVILDKAGEPIRAKPSK